MQKPSVSTTSRSFVFSWLPAVVFLGLVALSLTGLWAVLDRGFGDLLLTARAAAGGTSLSPQIFPVDLNDRAERNLGSAVESRQAFSDLFRLLGEGKLTGGMDFLFSGTKDPAGDAAMVDAASKMDGLVLAVVPVDPGITRFSGKELSGEEQTILRGHLWHPRVLQAGRIPVADTFLLPFLKLAQNSRYLGHIGVTPDRDGIYRKTPLFYRWADGYVPSLALAMAVSKLKLDPSQIVVDAGHSVTLPTKPTPLSIPVDDTGAMWIPYPAPWANTWKRTPLDKVVAAAADPDQETDLINLWDGGLVVAADLTTSHKDFGSTPLETVYPLSGIHTSVLNGILTRKLVAFPDPLVSSLETLLTGFLVFWVAGFRRFWAVHLGFGLVLSALFGFSAGMWFGWQVVPWFVAPALALFGAWVTVTGSRLYQTHQERTLMESALSRYFPKALATRVLQEKKVDLIPANKDLTLLFADIAGFTKWSSDKSAEQVHQFLSDYLESMAEILFTHGGTVDKFMGDGILAFFGDPFDQPDHAERCLAAALAMQTKVHELQARWGTVVGIDLKIRIGINSGRVIVGNLGSHTRIEYTVIGAAVNLAQRMESNAPVGGILVTEETWTRTKSSFRFGESREVKVKGYDEVLRAHVLEGKA